MEQSLKHLRFPLAILAVVVMSACGKSPNKRPPCLLPRSVWPGVGTTVNEWDEFTGRLEAPETVQIRPRVSGQIDQVAFTEGALVKKGDLLFQIDPRPFQAEVRRLEAQLAQTKAAATRSENEAQRGERLRQSNAISAELADRAPPPPRSPRRHGRDPGAVGPGQAEPELHPRDLAPSVAASAVPKSPPATW